MFEEITYIRKDEKSHEEDGFKLCSVLLDSCVHDKHMRMLDIKGFICQCWE